MFTTIATTWILQACRTLLIDQMKCCNVFMRINLRWKSKTGNDVSKLHSFSPPPLGSAAKICFYSISFCCRSASVFFLMSKPSDSDVMSLECAEVYSRTIIQCEEVETLQRACLVFRRLGVVAFMLETIPSRTTKTNPSASSAGAVTLAGKAGFSLDVGNSCGVCCKRREIVQGTCAHAAEAAESVLRYHEFNDFHASINERLRNASNRIRSNHLQFIARNAEQ